MIEMINEPDTVALTTDLPEHGLERGDVGAVVHVHSPAAFEVEFVAYDGHTVALVTLERSKFRALHERDIPHARIGLRLNRDCWSLLPLNPQCAGQAALDQLEKFV